MIELYGIKVSAEALIFFSLFLVSEVLPYTKFHSNGVAQFLISTAKTLKPFRKEDDKISKIKAQIEAIRRELEG